MSGRRGFQAPMLRLDRDTADRLLSGRVAADDAPPGYAAVAGLLVALRAPASDAELRRLDEAVSAAALLAAAGATGASAPTPRPRRSWVTRVKVVALAVLGAMVVTSGLAAAGVLPDAAQDVVSDVLSKVGIRVPPADHEPPGLDGTAPGLEHRPSALGLGDPETEDAAPPSVVPPAFEPNGSGTGRADEASGGKSEHGTTTANERSGGRSAAGAGNSDGHRGGPSQEPGNGSSARQESGPPVDRGSGPPPRGEHGGPPHANRP